MVSGHKTIVRTAFRFHFSGQRCHHILLCTAMQTQQRTTEARPALLQGPKKAERKYSITRRNRPTLCLWWLCGGFVVVVARRRRSSLAIAVCSWQQKQLEFD